ncbi:MAG: tetratricopeptide repeat protein [Oscillatoriales cyanobacterium C42_A2020_001]|nr:tetratricopeptide repeat protein [Leptolyngbyaceae cyanobacterium C42_A2020_001]
MIETRLAQTSIVFGLSTIALLISISPAPAQSAAEYRQQGLSLREQERYPEAIAALQKSVELEPENLSGRVLLGWTEHKAGQQAAATTTLLEALQLNPFEVPTLNALGIVYLVDGKLSNAIATHAWAAMLKPNNEIAYYNLSLAFERIQQYDWAIAAAQEAAKLEPSNPHPPVAQAIAHWGNGEVQQAKELFQQAIALDPRYTDADFLTYLNEAGFSQTQIEKSQAVLSSLR